MCRIMDIKSIKKLNRAHKNCYLRSFFSTCELKNFETDSLRTLDVEVLTKGQLLDSAEASRPHVSIILLHLVHQGKGNTSVLLVGAICTCTLT